MNINKALTEYIEENIIPIYDTLDYAHRRNHVISVIERSLDIAKEYALDLNIMYTIAAFHDVGLKVNRKTHHIEGAKMLKNDPFIQKHFTEETIALMAEAIEDHRASSKNRPRSLYGMIISEADCAEPVDILIARALLYRYKEGDTFDDVYFDVYTHLKEKYGKDGYIKVWLKTKYIKTMQQELCALMANKDTFRDYVHQIFNDLDKYR